VGCLGGGGLTKRPEGVKEKLAQALGWGSLVNPEDSRDPGPAKKSRKSLRGKSLFFKNVAGGKNSPLPGHHLNIKSS